MQRYLDQMLTAIRANPAKSITTRLPHARIKRIMKQDACANPRMIGGDAVPTMALACQLFVGAPIHALRNPHLAAPFLEPSASERPLQSLRSGALTHRAWAFAAGQQRHTLQVKDLLAAIESCDKFSFTIDVLIEFRENQMRDHHACHDDDHVQPTLSTIQIFGAGSTPCGTTQQKAQPAMPLANLDQLYELSYE